MPELEDLIMSQGVSDSPEETPEDRMRAALMQRLGVAPEVRAKQMSDQVLGQGGKGLSGLMNRIFGGAHEGLRVANDPKYRGAYQEALGAAMEQEKNLMPYARQLEMSGAMRDRAKMDSQEKARATFAKVFDTITKSINTKYKNETERSKALSEAKVDEAEIAQMVAKGNFLGAQTKLLETQNKWLVETGAKELPKEAVTYGLITGQKPGEEGFGKDFFSFERDKSIAKTAGPAMLKFLGGGGNRGSGGTRITESMRPTVTEGPDGKARVEYFPIRSTSTFTGGGNQSPSNPQALSAFGISPDTINKLGGPGQTPTAPQPQTPQEAAAGALGVKKPAPIKVPAPVGSISTSPTGRPPAVQLEGYKNSGAARAAAMRANVQNQASEVRSLLGSDLDLIDKIGAIRGNPTMLDLQRKSQDLGLSPDFSNNFIQFQQRATELELTKRYEFTGKASNSTEMKEIKSFSPNTGDTYKQALTKAVGLELATKYHNKLLESGDLKTPYLPGRMSQIAKDVADYYFDAAKSKDPAERKARLAEIEEMLTPEFIWDAMTRTRKKSK